MFLNGLTAMTCGSTFLYFIAYKIIGFKYYYGPLYIIPPGILLFYLHHTKKYKAARNLYAIGSLLIINYWCYEGRRTGNEYILAGVAVTSTLIFSRISVIFLMNFLCIAIFIVYKVYDATHPFVPDPAINYDVLPMVILVSTIGVLAYQMAFFRDLANHYDDKLSVKYAELNEAMELQRKTDEELMTSNEELKASNEQLSALTNQLEVIVKQKSLELQTYIDAINVNIYSAMVDAKGIILRMNEPLLKATGYERDELVGQSFNVLRADDHQHQNLKDFWSITLAGNPWRGEIKNKRKDGAIFWIDVVILPIKEKGEGIDYFLTLALPVTERKLYEESREKTIEVLESIAFNTSHNIRGPLTRIEGLATLIQKDSITPDEFQWVAEKMLVCTQELNKATTDLVGFVNIHAYRD
jgi:PAS domain S-box-containing protein